MKRLICLFVLFFFVFPAQAYVLGSGGEDWAGNSTTENMSEVRGTGYVEINNTINDHVSHWRFDEGSGTQTFDENVTNVNDGALMGDATWSSDAKYGSHSMQFDGTQDYVNCGNSSTLDISNITMSVWINSTGWNDTSNYNKIIQRYYNGDGQYLEYQYSGIDYWVFNNWYYDDVNFPFALSGCQLFEWNHVAAVYNGTHSQIYLNGVLMDTILLNESGTVDTNFTIGADKDGDDSWNGTIDDIRIFDYPMTNDEINNTMNNVHDSKGNVSTTVQDATASAVWTTIKIRGAIDTGTSFWGYWNYSTDGINFFLEPLGALTCGSNVTLYNQARYGSLIVEARTSTTRLTPVLHNITMYNETQHSAPTITSYDPTDANGYDVGESLQFHVQINPPCRCKWYLDNELVEFDQSGVVDQYYTYPSMEGGNRNITAVVDNIAGSASQTWLFEVGNKSADIEILSEDSTDGNCLLRWDVTRIGSSVVLWNVSYSDTTNGVEYSFGHDNGTKILNQTATSDDQVLWFDTSYLLPLGIYKITSKHSLTILANEYGLLRKNASVDQNASTVASTIENDTCYQWWNTTSQEWMAFYVGDAYNANIIIPKNVSYFVLVSAETKIECYEADAETVEMPAGWFSTLLRESTIHDLSTISSSMGANVTDLFAWDNSAYTWNNTGSFDVLPNQGVLANSSQAFEWDGSVP